MFPYGRQLTVLGQRSRLVHMHTHDMHTPVLGRARKTMHTLNDTQALDARMVLRVRVPWSTRHAPLQSRRVPNLDAPVVRGRYEEGVVGRNGEPRDAIRVGMEVGHERGFDATVIIVPGDEALACSVPSTDRSFMHTRTKVVL